MHLHQRKGHSDLFKWSEGGQEKNCLWPESSVSTAVGVFNLPKQNMCFQDVLRDYCSHSKHIMDVNCWLVVNRALSWEVSLPWSSEQPSGEISWTSLSKFLHGGRVAQSRHGFPQRFHITVAPLSGLDRLSERSGLFSAL